MNNVARTRRLAEEQKLEGVNFTDANGRITKDRSKVTRVELHFEFDQVIVSLQDFMNELRDVKFKLGR